MSRSIDADVLKEFLRPHDMWKNNRPYLTWEEIWEQECADIDAQPTVDSMKHGEWITKGQDIFCSACGEESAYNWYGASKFSNYCPNCGAEMGEVEE